MKPAIETPRHPVDVQNLKLDRIEPTTDGGLRIDALVTTTALAADIRVRRDYGVLASAIVAGASGQPDATVETVKADGTTPRNPDRRSPPSAR